MPDRIRQFVRQIVALQEFRTEAVASLLGATLRCETDTGYRAAHTLSLPLGGPFTTGAVASSRKSGWLCVSLEVDVLISVGLATLEGDLLEQPHTMEPRHVTHSGRPVVVGTDHHFRVPAGQLTLRFARGPRSSPSDERLEEVLLSNEPAPGLDEAPKLREQQGATA